MPTGVIWHFDLHIGKLTRLSNAPIEGDDIFVFIQVGSIDDDVLDSNKKIRRPA